MKELKKMILGSALIMGLVLSGEALAQKWGPMPLSAPQEKVAEFCKEIQPLYQKEVTLRNEIRTSIWQGNPNWDVLLEKEIEAAKLKVEILKKAQEKGLPLRGVFGNVKRYCGI